MSKLADPRVLAKMGLRGDYSDAQAKHLRTIARAEQQKQFYSDSNVRSAEFRICPRARYYDWSKVTDFDRQGECNMCSVPIVFDAVVTADRVKVCGPCAWKCYQSGFKAVEGMVTNYQPDESGYDDEYFHNRLNAALTQNKDGAVRPDVVLPNVKPATVRGQNGHFTSALVNKKTGDVVRTRDMATVQRAYKG